MDIYESISRAGGMNMKFPAYRVLAITRITALFYTAFLASVSPGISQADLSVHGFGEMNYYPGITGRGRTVINQQRLRLNVLASRGAYRLKVWTEMRKNDTGSRRPVREFLAPEVYGEFIGETFFARIGKQQIVWGSADGLFINDVVNPLDLREFLLPDLENVRLGQPSVRLQWRRSNWNVEGVWILKFAETKPALEMMGIPPEEDGPPVVMDAPEKPPVTFGNSEIGLRITGMVGRWDIALNYLRAWRDIATNSGNIIISGSNQSAVLMLKPYYQRISTWGGNLSRPFKSVLLRGEFSYVPGIQLETKNPAVNSMVGSHDFLACFIGADFQVRKTRIGFQLAQEKIFGDEDLLNREKTGTVMTFLVDRTFFRDSMQLLIFADREFDFNDTWVKTQIGYRVNRQVKVTAGSHVFSGNESGLLGRFHDWSSIYFRVRYSFST